MASRSRRAQYSDLEAVPPLMVGEIIGGELITSPRPSSKPTRVASRLAGLLMQPFDIARDAPGGWVILFEPEIHMYGDAAVPDLAGWRRERMPVIPDVAAFALAPDWVCEVLSRNNPDVDRKRKMPLYAGWDVPNAWLIDPDTRTLEIFQLDHGAWGALATHSGDVIVRAPPFDAIELNLALLWES